MCADGRHGDWVLVVDLHGLRVADGEALTAQILDLVAGEAARPTLRVITGRGAHNVDGRSPLRESR